MATATEDRVEAVADIPWRLIRPMPGQPREYFDPNALRELAGSIAAVGQVVPVIVAPIQDRVHRYELIDGQRRWHAVQLAGLRCVRAQVVAEPDPEKRYVKSVIANMHRQPNHPMEIAEACRRMRETMTVAEVAATLGKGPSDVFRHLSLLNLCPELRAKLHPSTPKDQRLPVVVATRLAKLDPLRQVDAYRRIMAEDVSPMRAADRVLGYRSGGAQTPMVRPPVREGADPVEPDHTPGRKPQKDFEVALRRLKAAAHDLGDFDPRRFGLVMAGRKAEDRQVVYGLLQRVEQVAARLAEAMK